MSNDQNRPRPSAPAGARRPRDRGDHRQGRLRRPEKKGPDRPSATQLTAGALAAVTTTFLASYLGVAGTIIGAGLSSIITVLGSYIYTTSLRRTADKVTAAAPLVRVRALSPGRPPSEPPPPGRHARPPAPQETGSPARADDPSAVAAAEAAAAPEGPGRWRAAWRAVVERYGYRRLVAMVVGVFVVIIGAVTLVEVAAGKPLSDVVRNEQGRGTTIGVTSGTTSRETPEAPATPSQGAVRGAHLDPGVREHGHAGADADGAERADPRAHRGSRAHAGARADPGPGAEPRAAAEPGAAAGPGPAAGPGAAAGADERGGPAGPRGQQPARGGGRRAGGGDHRRVSAPARQPRWHSGCDRNAHCGCGVRGLALALRPVPGEQQDADVVVAALVLQEPVGEGLHGLRRGERARPRRPG